MTADRLPRPGGRPVMRHLRLRLGAWLMRPYLQRAIHHYAKAAADAHKSGERDRSERCDYIVIGLSYALTPTPSRWEETR